MWQRSQHLFREHQATHPDTPLVYAVPLLAEGDRRDEFDLVVVVDAPAAQRITRLVDKRDMSDDQARARVSAQATDQARLAIADVVIDSSGNLAHTRSQAKMLAAQLRTHWPDSLRAIPRLLTGSGE